MSRECWAFRCEEPTDGYVIGSKSKRFYVCREHGEKFHQTGNWKDYTPQTEIAGEAGQ